MPSNQEFEINLPEFHLPEVSSKIVWSVIVLVVFIWLASGLYMVGTDEAGVELRFALDYSESVKEIQQYSTSDFNRVVNNNPLARHFRPAYIRMAISYARGASAAIIKQAIVDHINAKATNAFLTVYDINKILVQNKVARVEEAVEYPTPFGEF